MRNARDRKVNLNACTQTPQTHITSMTWWAGKPPGAVRKLMESKQSVAGPMEPVIEDKGPADIIPLEPVPHR